MMQKPAISRYAAQEEYYFEEGCFITENWNQAEDEACSIARARVPPEGHTQTHRLLGSEERYLIIQGQGVVYLGDAEGQEVGPGDVVVIPAGVEQSIRNTGQEDLVFYAICTPRFRPEAYQSDS
jgi:mannose-6-phosphate isomerase-like protein (cupin superfamily)